MRQRDQPNKTHPSATLFWIETALTSAAGFLTVLTLFTREWIEALFNVDPDGGDGSLEWRRTQPVHG